MKKLFLIILAILLSHSSTQSWGFYAHRQINKLAVFTLPLEMFPFYKKHINYLSDHAVDPDKRRYAVEEEAARHFIDLDVYSDSLRFKMPHYWNDAVDLISEDTLKKYGIVPWHILKMKNYLTKAFKDRDSEKILKLSAEIGHYIADAHVPLHTTQNYNGQLSGQNGIHGFWESRLPELFMNNYDLFVGRAEYLKSPQKNAWKGVKDAHMAVDSVLKFEKHLSLQFPSDKKYAPVQRGQNTTINYSLDYSRAYHKLLGDQVERQMRRAVKMIGDFWYTCWVDAGQPKLTDLNRGEGDAIVKNDSTLIKENCSER
ncbi:zinc dependent phospholipase C family protein [Xanthovirga aplysinae]|uniref:zinc dependent phospholipase C family protein n=1 Tax=Xanthovirga aplysinae TaxID=2529853 RepID=UPI00165700CC|nr:S1/P1 Nuclease [Xanthovirga aplysinae]